LKGRALILFHFILQIYTVLNIYYLNTTNIGGGGDDMGKC
jgi:hypothetical protein